MLEQVNIRAVIELAELSSASRKCDFHHISSTAVLGPNPIRVDICPNNILELPLEGYGQSKLAAELALLSISEQSMPISIYRIGELMPSTESIVPNPRSIVICYLRTLAYIGYYPIDVDCLDYCPVDATVSQILDHSSSNTFDIFGLANQSRVPLDEMMKCFNSPQRKMTSGSRSQVYEAIRREISMKNTPDFLSVIWSIIGSLGPKNHWPILSYSKTRKCLKGDNGTWPTIDKKYLSNSLIGMSETQAKTTPL